MNNNNLVKFLSIKFIILIYQIKYTKNKKQMKR